MSAEPYYLAHTARCKLKIAANQPDRNLRFILGHAFTLDNIMLRVMEIESESSSEDSLSEGENRVSFRNNSKPHSSKTRHRSPPPTQVVVKDIDDDLSDEEEEYMYDDEEENGLSLRRYESGTVQPPRMVHDDSSSSDEDEGPVSPTLIPSELELESITAGAANEELADMYQHLKGCPCNAHHEHAPTVTKAWDVPQKVGLEGKRYAVVQIAS